MSSGKVALITGGSGGLGKMAAIFLGREKWRLMVNCRNYPGKLDEWMAEVTGENVEMGISIGDISRRNVAKRVVQETLERYGRIDALIHAVGPFIRERKWFIEHSANEIEELVHGNLLSAMWMAHSVLPVMRRHNWGRILFFGFGRAVEAPAWPDRSVYAAAKTGLVSFTKTLAVEEAPYGITVNMICPGDIVKERKEMCINDVKNIRDDETPCGRPGSGEDVARLILFLLRSKSDFVTGNIMQVTGGLDVIHPVSKRER
ncbi:SDR family oxidoreductase [Thermoactinomyces mirandus]|uniref:SDR family oxidoreductase n=1 Tax=Thermoactinomyces mirandus TaxID=2756294 RepID=A0A7W1XT65_9BACL|nr:SDR family oxidoreductase [Thermoactinomyces mirandus]MBA4602760.1 SDR family oxidoreductase [Thermoactinomyces mirandus]